MYRQFTRAACFACALFALATTAQAQGRGNGDKGQGSQGHGKVSAVYHAPGNGERVPPGLAKKPGQMPPGQYKKYSTSDGATVLGDILRRNGYRVDRVTTSGNSRYVYYRTPSGSLRRAIVSPGATRLGFQNVPTTLLQQVLARLR